MIIYFADRKLNILGQASTNLPLGMTIIDDLKTEDVETGVAVFEVTIGFDAFNRLEAQRWAEVGNYILRSHKDENEFYTIIDAEIDTKNQEIRIYAEDAGLDLLNEVVGAYEADKAYPISFYIDKFAKSSGFVVGVNEVSNLTRKLSWDGEATVTERLASVATQFDNCEISYSFDIKGLAITKMYINIYRKRGHDIGCQLRINKEVDRIITKKSIANLATALEVTGGTPEGKDTPITLQGYKYDDGDFYVTGTRLCSRKALQKWGRLPIGTSDHVVKKYSYDTLTQSTLCKHAVTELRKICDMEVNYEVDITRFPDNTKIGDRINIIDDAGELYLSTRILQFETSVVQATQKATLGEHLLKGSGISQKVIELAEQFAKNTLSAQKALEIANAANNKANEAQTEANNALTQSQAAQNTANDAKVSADKATQSAADATQKTAEMQEAVNKVEQSVTSIEKTVTDAKQAADNAVIAADTANKKADEAKAEAGNAVLNANEAKDAAMAAGTKADSAIVKANDAVETAGTAKTEAETASATAAAAKADAVQAQKDVDALGSNLETVKNTMKLDYARKTDLTSTEAKLQTQITQNADTIEQTASKVVTIDETANNAKEIANKASADALAAQTKADAAQSEATAAQTAADKAKEAATAAQTNADNAKQAAADAQAVANKAETDLTAAKNDLATVQGRVDATEQDILEAQAKVDAAQQAADKAKTDAANAQTEASKAQETANAAVTDAANAQNAANDAANKATLAQQAADKANGNAEAAKTKAEQAEATAVQAQTKAEEAVTNATNAKKVADQAKIDADNAAKAASDADLKAQQAQQNLVEAEKNLAAVSSKVDATKEEVDAAQAAVTEAKTAAEKAKTDAIAAQNTANTAKANADKAQLEATAAQTAADKAKETATAAQNAADKAQDDVNALEKRTEETETTIRNHSRLIELKASKKEVTETLAGYYTKKEADAAIKLSADNIESTVSKTYATKDGVTQQIGTAITQSEKDLTVKINNIQVGGSNLLLDTKLLNSKKDSGYKYVLIYDSISKGYLDPISENKTGFNYAELLATTEGISTYLRWITWVNSPLLRTEILDKETVLSFEYQLTKEYETADSPICVEYYLTNAVGASRIYYKLFYIKSDNLIIDNVSRWSKFEFKATITDELFNNIQGGTTEISKDSCPYVVVRIYGNKAYNLKMRKFKLEVGNKATDWTPAQKDVDLDIENAKKTATNYLNFSDKGLVVGDMTKTSLGNNVLIDSDSVDIRNGENKLASFGANKIELGVGNKQSNIYFCDGSGYINYDVKDYGDLGTYTGLCLTSDTSGIQLVSHAGGSDKGEITLIVDNLRDSNVTTRSILNVSSIFRFYNEKMYSGVGTATHKEGIDFLLQPSNSWLHLDNVDGESFQIDLSLNSNSPTGYDLRIDGNNLECYLNGNLSTYNINALDIDSHVITATGINSKHDLPINSSSVGIELGHGNEINFTSSNTSICFGYRSIGGNTPSVYAFGDGASNAYGGTVGCSHLRSGKGGLIEVSSANNLVIGDDAPVYDSVRIYAASATTKYARFYIFNRTTDQEMLAITYDGTGQFIRTEVVRDRKYGYIQAQTVRCTSNGVLGQSSSSSRRYKKDIISIEDNLKKHASQDLMERLNIEPIINPNGLYNIPIMQYKYIDGYLAADDPTDGKDVIGIMAEDVAKFYPTACILDDNGEPEAWSQEPIVVGLLYLVQEQKKEIEAIKQQLKGIIK